MSAGSAVPGAGGAGAARGDGAAISAKGGPGPVAEATGGSGSESAPSGHSGRASSESAVLVGATNRTRQELEALAVRVHGEELEFTMAEVAKHNSKTDCWLVAHGQVYDVTEFLRRGLHPGGEHSIARYAGTDATVHFDFHGRSAHRLWHAYRIGYIKGDSACVVA